MSIISDQNCDVHLYAEIEILKQALVDKQNELIAMETTCLRETDRQAELEDSIIAWQDKYDRLYESHKRVQKVNQTLEDKLLKLVDRNSGERAQLTSDVATLSVRLAQANYNIATLQREIERYKTDMSLAIQLLQCKPDSFVSQKVSSLPLEIQSKVAQYMRLDSNSHSDSEGSTSGVGVATSGAYRVLPASDSPPPLCPFPPTAMVYSMRGIDDQSQNDSQMISPSVIAKYLEDELKSSEIKHCDTCSCTNRDLTVLADTALTYSVGTQTILQGDANNSLCLRCNSNLNSPSRTNSPYIIKLVKSSDSVISETKSSMSGSNDNEKLFTPVKKDELMVNPILGHHRLCDRTPKIIDTASKCIEMQMIDSNSELHLKQHKSPIAVSGGESGIRSPNGTITTTSSNHSVSNAIKKNDASQSQCSGKESSEQMVKNESIQKTGSTNSLWSKTSSNTNLTEGAKIFENFNRNLIKSMKVDNLKTTGPRLCALRIQNGTSNILLDNIESEHSPPVVYTRRSRFLDEELDESKDIITSLGHCETSNISMVMSGTAATSTTNIDLKQSNYDEFTNKNFIETASKSGKMNISSSSNSERNIMMDTIKQHQMGLDKLESETMSSKNANQSCTQSSSISSEMNIQESAMLRRQQLTRVAEWVQNNHLDQMDPLSSQSASSSMDAGSTDSGYKTKPHACGANDVVVIVDSERNRSKDKLNDIIVANIKDGNRIIVSSLSDNCKLSPSKRLLDNSFAQIQNNNNFLKSNGGDYMNHLYLQNCIDNSSSQMFTVTANGNSTEIGKNAQIDLAQMEYNVKQFLLKQNEWSIHNKDRFDGNNLSTVSTAAVAVTKPAATVTSNATKILHRTETNL